MVETGPRARPERTADRQPLYYTFGNHMHWVDMQWLWGYHVLPNSVRDMLHFCDETGAKGNINFDGIGYEKLAVEAPEALTKLREAIAAGQIEVVGASYGQPYGLFHGGESNVRQRVYGVRAVMRLLGTRPRTFWEEEFDFFPQLPQMLRSVGYEYGSLFFQWTWHTPVVPYEDLPAVWWEGMDGSRILASARNHLNLHQWPEDFAGVLESDVPRQMPAAGIVQWLELMPSPDWMCRSELLLPQLRQLMAHPDFELRFVTLSEYLEVAREHAEVRRYTLDDVFHGMSLGKNGDLFRRLSRRTEHNALTAEALSSLAGLFGRPYPHWDVYPTWELEEAWRELLAAQHHDNDECEGLCGHVGQRSYERSLSLTQHVIDRSLRLLADRVAGDDERVIVFNPLGWSRDGVVTDPRSGEARLIRAVPPFGYRTLSESPEELPIPEVTISEDEQTITLARGDLKVTIDRASGTITQIISADFPQGILAEPLLRLEMTRSNRRETFLQAKVTIDESEPNPQVRIERRGEDGAAVTITISLAAELDAVDLRYTAEKLPRPDALMHAALQTLITPRLPGMRLVHDHPYGLSEIQSQGKTYLRKYPSGEWMTSEQYFEEVHNPFTALGLLDFDDGERGLLYLHDGSQAMLRDGSTVRNILSMYDAWDEEYFVDSLDARFRLIPHGAITNTQRWKWSQEFTGPLLTGHSHKPGGELPQVFGGVWCDATGVAVSAFFRETEESGAHLKEYAGRGMEFPYVLRLVEFDGKAATARLRLPGPVETAIRTNALGEPMETLTVSAAPAPEEIADSRIPWTEITLKLRPYEIATVYVDMVYGRKVPRNLDAHRSVWATVHRVDES
jgi:alpha-mannosidase